VKPVLNKIKHSKVGSNPIVPGPTKNTTQRLMDDKPQTQPKGTNQQENNNYKNEPINGS
jgi:DNA replication initiation complex subunit (GINS family)